MFTANQLIAHAVGDYILQSHCMATQKTKSLLMALIHATTYAFPFTIITQSPIALAVIIFTHAIIDRYRLARYVSFIKNQIGQIWDWKECDNNGYPKDTPIWLSTWLLIITDNLIHIIINALAIQYL